MSLLYSSDLELIVERVEKLRDKLASAGRAVSYDDLGRAVGLSGTTVYNFLKHKDPGNSKVAEQGAALRAWLEREELKADSGMLRIPFAETRPASRFMEAYQFALKYNKLVAVLGHSGFGKTRTIEELRRRDRTLIVVTAWSQMGASGLLKELCEETASPTRGLQIALMKRLRHKLTGSNRVIIVDDAHTLKFNALDLLRYLYDQTGVGMVLSGIGSLRRHLVGTSDETEQLASRVSGRIFELPDLNGHDVRSILVAAMGVREAERALGVIERHETIMASARRLGNVLEMASAFAHKAKAGLAIEHVEKALKVAA